MTNNDPLLTTEQAANYLDVRPQTLVLWRQNDTHPDLLYIKIGRNVRYRQSALDKWLESRTVGNIQ